MCSIISGTGQYKLVMSCKVGRVGIAAAANVSIRKQAVHALSASLSCDEHLYHLVSLLGGVMCLQGVSLFPSVGDGCTEIRRGLYTYDGVGHTQFCCETHAVLLGKKPPPLLLGSENRSKQERKGSYITLEPQP